MGNHDRLAIGQADASRFSKHALASAPVISEDGAGIVHTFAPSYRAGSALFFHGSPENDEEYLFNEVDVRRALDSNPDVNLMFCGHLHIPRVARFSLNSENLQFEEIDPGGSEHVLNLESFRYIINVPSLWKGRLGFPPGFCVVRPLSVAVRFCFEKAYDCWI